MIAKLAPRCRIIDLTHGIPAGDVRAGALALTRSVQYLPESVVLAVVDPGVGTSRRAIAAETEVGIFVGPDNGLLSPAVAMVGGAGRIVAIENPDIRIPSPGATFDGRDLFGPAAALLAAGEVRLEDLGPEVDPASVVPLLLPLPSVSADRVSGEVWWVDGFGNCQTNLGPADLEMAGMRPGQSVALRVGAVEQEAIWVDTYASAAHGQLLIHLDSAGLMALAVRGGRAADQLNLAPGRAVSLSSG